MTYMENMGFMDFRFWRKKNPQADFFCLELHSYIDYKAKIDLKNISFYIKQRLTLEETHL